MQKLAGVLKDKKRRIIYMLCFAFACLIDQRTKTCTGLDGWLESFRDMTGVVMAVIIMSHFKLSEIKRRRLPYIVWSLICIVGVVPAALWGQANRPFFNDWCVILLDIILFGYILIYTAISIFVEKRAPRLNVKFAVVWAVMLVLMLVSRSTYLWPLAYLVMFGCFYLTDYDKEEENDLFQGMLDGIILAFFMMQGWCFVFRPFDEPRYLGVYSNPNLNALFYVVVLAAVFAKIIYVTRIQANKWLRLYYWLGAGVVYSFIFLTIGRTAWITSFVLGLVFLGSMKAMLKKKNFMINGMILVLCAALTFPLCFAAVRYLPPAFHHPVWFWGEWSEDKVHSWDKWDSEKFVDFGEFMSISVGRIWDSASDAIYAGSDSVLTPEELEELMKTPEGQRAVLTEEQRKNSFLVRTTIYKQYLMRLNLWGHPYEEQGFQLSPTRWIGHAHNIYLQYGTDFGIIAMGLFIVATIWSIVFAVRKLLKVCEEYWVGHLLLLMIPVVFGMLEYSWGVGSIPIFLLFIAWRKVICNEE